jgi:cyclopropane fatty-acyl-phospholipid synthase-like methyltransferase
MPDTPATDWTRYYESPFITAHVTRRITRRILANMLASAEFPAGGSIIELGGGNSVFCSTLVRRLHVSHYLAVDSNPRGAELFRTKHPGPETESLCTDIFTLDAASIEPADLVFSIGLVEHFSEERAKTAVRRHFELAKPGGLVLISFPTPTFSYRLIRRAAEKLGIWRFPDERPIPLEDAVALCAGHGEIMEKRLNRAILLTQGIVLARVPR